MNFKQFLFIEKTYLKNLKKISEGAVAKIKASDIVYKPSKKFQIPRKDMPQVKSEDFNDLLKFFEKDGVRITNDR